jgi:hypothetical protein
MGTIVDPASLIIDYRLSITKRDKQTDDFRLPPSSDVRLPIVAEVCLLPLLSLHRQAYRQAGR